MFAERAKESRYAGILVKSQSTMTRRIVTGSFLVLEDFHADMNPSPPNVRKQ
jgi:hypothetical protein